MEDVTSYLTFVLGYDLLEDVLKKDTDRECNIAYAFCSRLAKQFLDTNKLSFQEHSAYTLLDKWVDDNIFQIVEDYAKFLNAPKEPDDALIDNQETVAKL